MRPRPVQGLILLLLANLLAAGCRSGGDTEPTVSDSRPAAASTLPTPEERIRFHEAALARDPRLYPAWTQLAEAWLDAARRTRDPEAIERAAEALDRSLAIQPSFEAFRAMAALQNFRHRFSEAATWGRKAAEALPSDTSVAALRVEAHLGRGDLAGAEEILAPFRRADDFYLATARARIAAAEDDIDLAVQGFTRAAEHARRAGVRSLELWARIRAAGVLLDSGRATEAKPFLESAALLDAGDPTLRIHEAELAEASGDVSRALAIYEELLQVVEDPLMRVAAARCARKVGATTAARDHATRAEEQLQRILDHDEVYALEPLARLYLDGGTNLERALELAQLNAKVHADVGARELMAEIERALAALPRDPAR